MVVGRGLYGLAAIESKNWFQCFRVRVVAKHLVQWPNLTHKVWDRSTRPSSTSQFDEDPFLTILSFRVKKWFQCFRVRVVAKHLDQWPNLTYRVGDRCARCSRSSRLKHDLELGVADQWLVYFRKVSVSIQFTYWWRNSVCWWCSRSSIWWKLRWKYRCLLAGLYEKMICAPSKFDKMVWASPTQNACRLSSF